MQVLNSNPNTPLEQANREAGEFSVFFLQHDAISIKEASLRLGISRSSIYRAFQKMKIKTVKIGSRRLIPSSEIFRLISDSK